MSKGFYACLFPELYKHLVVISRTEHFLQLPFQPFEKTCFTQNGEFYSFFPLDYVRHLEFGAPIREFLVNRCHLALRPPSDEYETSDSDYSSDDSDSAEATGGEMWIVEREDSDVEGDSRHDILMAMLTSVLNVVWCNLSENVLKSFR